ncbi:Dynamin [Gracilaria domingensis]|nr:Dynamin [Gracilaria domingensis]
MPVRSIQQEMRSGYIGNVLNAINNTEAQIGRQQISFPRIAVFGDESTGKSSLLESICKIPFPRGSKVTTKCPTQVRLQHKHGQPFSGSIWSAGVEGQKQRNRREFQNPEDITALISEIQQLELQLASKKTPGVKAAFTDVPITISIEGDDVVDLTLVDLPGFILRERLNQGRESKDMERVQNTLIDYMDDPRTILLVVVPANSNLKNANIVDLLVKYEEELTKEEVESFRARIIYCLTKCDLVGDGPKDEKAPQDIEEILKNEGPFQAFPHGWYAIVSNGSKSTDKDFRRRLQLDRESEMNYFRDHMPYCKPDILKRCGTHNLVMKLSK